MMNKWHAIVTTFNYISENTTFSEMKSQYSIMTAEEGLLVAESLECKDSYVICLTALLIL
jgi:hypothetical protein